MEHDIVILSVAVIVLFWVCVYLVYLYNRIASERDNLQNANKAKSFFIHKLGYELRNPLNGIVGFSEMLGAGYYDDLSVRQKERVAHIKACGYQLQELVDELISLNKGSDGFMELLESKIAVKSLINDMILKDIETRVHDSGITLVTDFPRENIMIQGDIRKIVQMIKNIIDNALKFTPRGGQITIKDEERGPLVISISDTGKGMCSEEVETIFLSPSDVNKASVLNGVGIGMPLAKLIADLHDIKIVVDSVEDLGTTVRIKFPEKRFFI